jgi:predicted nucleotidyltransferase component of viral defense system
LAEEKLRTWEALFRRALLLLDSARAAGATLENWSFGGGTVLMRRHRHRLSKDVDIFFPDPQILPYLSPRLNDTAGSMTTDYVEQAGFLKLVFPEGEIDFVASETLTQNPINVEMLFDQEVRVETSTEIIAKKVWHRGEQFTARDIFDLALVAEREPEALWQIKPVLHGRQDVILNRIAALDTELREAFDALEVLDYRRSFDDCVQLVEQSLRQG